VDDARGQFDPDRSDAAVPTLTTPGALVTEPVFVDVSGDSPWDPDTPTFRDKVTDLAAPIHGKSKYQLAGDDVRELRRFRRLRRAAIGALALLTAIALAAAVIAVMQRQDALRQRNQAEASRLIAQGQAMLAGVEGGGDFRALQQILAGQLLSGGYDALFTAAVQRLDTLKVIEAGEPVLSVAVSLDGKHIITGGQDMTAVMGRGDG
jgi:hypothetical protein